MKRSRTDHHLGGWTLERSCLSLADVRGLSGQRYSRSEAGDFGVRRPARRTRVRRRGRVLPNSPRLETVRSAAAPKDLALATLVEFVASGFSLAGRPWSRYRSSCGCSRRSLPRMLVRGFGAAMSASRLARPARCDRRTASARLAPLGTGPSRPLLTQRFAVAAKAKARTESRRVFSGPTCRATRLFTSVIWGVSKRRALDESRVWHVGGAPEKTSERAAGRAERNRLPQTFIVNMNHHSQSVTIHNHQKEKQHD